MFLPVGISGEAQYQIQRSLRFNSADSAYLSRTPASAGNRRTWTWSGWVKRSKFQSGWLLAADNGTLYSQVQFDGDYLRFGHVPNTGGTVYGWRTQAVFRDPSAWYHIVFAIDTTQATATNRIRIYVNGVEQTGLVDATGYGAIPQNTDTLINLNVSHMIGRFIRGSNNPYDGYLTEINFIDGQALTPSSFGETNPNTGVWQPKKYTGTYGTNGFYLNFSDNSAATAAAIGKDYSGNGNNWTPNNISVTAGVTYDSMIDTPTPYADGGNGRGNYCVANILTTTSTAQTYSNGNLQVASTFPQSVGTIGVSSGKFYAEAVMTALGVQGVAVGVQSLNQISGSAVPIRIAGSVGYWSYGNKIIDNVDSSYGAMWAANDVIGIAVDLDGNQITFYKNGVSQGVISYTFSNYSNWTFGAGSGGAAGASTLIWNFGQRPFAYTPPTGFKALNTQNLPEPTIKKGNQYFDATTYTGTGASRSVTNAGGFSPDLVWMKIRSSADSHGLFDSVRGAGYRLQSNDTGVESLRTDVLTSFNSDGFSISGSDLQSNANGSTYVAWQWRASDSSAVTNTAGSITSTVSANPTAGFSIVTYTGTGANATVGHGLGDAPKFVIIKNRDYAQNWPVWFTGFAGSEFLTLNTTNGKNTDTTLFNSTVPTSTVFSIGTANQVNFLTAKYVAYCFAAVAGYSAFGSYTGNGSADGPFVFTNHRPAFLLIKRTDTTSNWTILDLAREGYNVDNDPLYPNLSNAEGTTDLADILSNGFKLRSTDASVNANTGTYIYMSLASNPFKYSLAR